MAHSTTNCVTGNMFLTLIQGRNVKATLSVLYKAVTNSGS